jgi:hypothetical protein
MTTQTKDRPQIIPSTEATLLALAEAPGATIGLSDRQEEIARQIDAQLQCEHPPAER